MILCCKVCGNCFEASVGDQPCDYCCGGTEVLFTDAEEQAIDKHELGGLIRVAREKYKVDNPYYDQGLWESREYKERVSEQNAAQFKINSHMRTTGYNFEGHEIVSYRGIVSGQVVLGTGFLSEFTASFSDFFGVKSNRFAEKLENAKNAAMGRMIRKSVELGGNAVIGVDFDYIMFENNMVGVIANGTSVIVEEIRH